MPGKLQEDLRSLTLSCLCFSGGGTIKAERLVAVLKIGSFQGDPFLKQKSRNFSCNFPAFYDSNFYLISHKLDFATFSGLAQAA